MKIEKLINNSEIKFLLPLKFPFLNRLYLIFAMRPLRITKLVYMLRHSH